MAIKRDVVLQSAEKLLAKGKFDQAIKEYVRLLEDNPNDVATLNKVGDLYVRLNRAQDSIAYFTRIAEYYARDGFFLKAIAIYKKINKLDPSRLEIYERLADLYHKQGLNQDARSQYQILADHYLGQNNTRGAVAVYRKMAAIDPGDIKTAVRLADLYTASGQTDEALAQYGLIGSMLAARGATDEAVAVYQKALKIKSDDPAILKSLVRSLADQGKASQAIALLRVLPPSPATLLHLAECFLATGDLSASRKAAEDALKLTPESETARLMIGQSLLREGNVAEAVAMLMPAAERAGASGDVRRAIAVLTPILQIDPLERQTLSKLAALYEMSGDQEALAQARYALGREALGRGDEAAASEYYRTALELQPDHSEIRQALSSLRAAGPLPTPLPPSAQPAPPPEPRAATPVPVAPLPPPAAPPASPEEEALTVEFEPTPPPPVQAPQPSVPSLDWESTSPPPPPRVETPPSEPRRAVTPPPPPPVPAASASRARYDVADLTTEAEVFAKYGLLDKAVDKYREVLKHSPGAIEARNRYVELLAEVGSSKLVAEAQNLAAALRRAGRDEEAVGVVERYVPPGSPPPTAMPPIPPLDEVLAPESAAAPPRPTGPIALGKIDFAAFDDFGSAPAMPPPAPPSAAPLSGRVPTEEDLEFRIDSDLSAAIEKEMAAAAGQPAPAPATPEPVDEASLFSDEQSFFNLAAELEKELAEEATPVAPPMEEGGDVSLEQIFREFKKGVEQQLNPEDYETHYNLGIAYKEMGLVDEAIGEFQLASKDPVRMIECCSMLGLCFLEKGLPQLALKWYRKGLESPNLREEERLGFLYDLAGIYQQTGDVSSAYNTYLEIYGINSNYRDVVFRVKELEAALGK
jgi:tetratricopeptide (TPR) repeat protein